MARRRLLSPEFWTDSNIVQLTPYARLLFMGCWNFALCEEGHLADSPLELKMKILPADPVNGDELVEELVKLERLVRGVTPSGKPYLWVRKLSNHQKADLRWQSRCFVCAEIREDEPPATSPKLPETQPSLDETQHDSPKLPETQPISALGKASRGSKEPSPADAGTFDDFWRVYPLKHGKQDALKAWAKAVKRAPPAVIISGAQRYRDDPNRDDAHTKWAQGWLNSARWDDPPLPGRDGVPAPPSGWQLPDPPAGMEIGGAEWQAWRLEQQNARRTA